MEKKVCSKCKEEKEVCEFGKDKTKKSGYNSQCKSCTKEWRLKNKTHLVKYHKKWKTSNSEHIYNYSKTYKQNNKEKIEEYYRQWKQKNKNYFNEYMINKRKNDPQFHLITLVRSRLYEFLKFRKITKRNTTEEIVGCTKEFLKEHIEKQFTEGMSWDLMGKYIHIDHIIPLSSAKTEDELYELCRYTNLQPLWAEDNLKKSNKLL
jgi:hypothetical protein